MLCFLRQNTTSYIHIYQKLCPLRSSSSQSSTTVQLTLSHGAKVGCTAHHHRFAVQPSSRLSTIVQCAVNNRQVNDAFNPSLPKLLNEALTIDCIGCQTIIALNTLIRYQSVSRRRTSAIVKRVVKHSRVDFYHEVGFQHTTSIRLSTIVQYPSTIVQPLSKVVDLLPNVIRLAVKRSASRLSTMVITGCAAVTHHRQVL